MVVSENAETVTIKGCWHPHLLKVALTQLPIAKVTFCLDELTSQNLTASIVYQQEQAALGTAIFQPGMIRAIDLDQFSPPFSAFPRRVNLFGFLGLGKVQVLPDHQLA